MIKVLRESLVVTNVHRVLGIVNGTTNFVLTEMESGSSYDDALASAQARGYAEADPTDDVSGADAAAKMAILATVAFNSRVTLDDVRYSGITTIDPADVAAARRLDMAIRLVGAARLVDGQVDVSVHPALVDNQHPLAKVDGAFNAVMLQGDAIREITLEGPGAGGVETASAVIADITSVIGTMGTGFLENDAAWRDLPTLPEGDSRSPFYFRLHVEDRPGALARVAEGLAEREISVARLLQHAERQRRGAARRHARGARRRARGCVARDRTACGRAPQLGAVARHLRPRRRGARMDVGSLLARGGLDAARSRARATARLGRDVFLKCEGVNPTGSFKDRGMVRAVAGAFAEGRPSGLLRLDGQHRGLRGRVRRARRPRRDRADAGRRRRDRETRAGACLRRAGGRDPGQLRRCPPAGAGARPAGRLRARQLAQPAAHRGTEDRRRRSCSTSCSRLRR